MGIGLAFWIIFLISLIFTGWSSYPDLKGNRNFFVIFVLIFLLGWGVFGFILQGR